MYGHIKKAFRTLRNEGIAALTTAARREIQMRSDDQKYRDWVARFDVISDVDRRSIRSAAAELTNRPLISVIMPVYNVEERFLREALDSVCGQLYENWELCIADDHSTESHVREVLEEYATKDERIKVVFRERNGHISAASNSALELASGEFAALMDHDDLLAEDALYQVAAVLDEFPETDLIYSDEDKIDASGKRFQPMFKPDWSPELLYSLNMLTHLCVFRTSILREIGGFREGFEGSQDYDLSLRFIEKTKPGAIRHIPHVLYHWRAIPGSVALDADEKTYAHERARTAIDEHYKRVGIQAKTVRSVAQMHRPVFSPLKDLKISVILASSRALGIKHSENYEIELINCEGFASGDTRRYALLNQAASSASGNLLIFLDGTTTKVSDGFIDELAGRAMRDGVGAVGGKIVNSRGRILHAGFTLGIKGGVGRTYHGESALARGRFSRLSVDMNLSAVSVNCLAIRRDLFEQFGGFDAEPFPEQYADVDLCLRLAAAGYRTVWTPWATAVQEDKETTEDAAELTQLKSNWPAEFTQDKYYNPNLTIELEDLSLPNTPRVKRIPTADGSDT